MDSEDGQTFVKNLATFVRTHERALANALHLQSQRSKSGAQPPTSSSSKSPAPSPSLTRSYNPFSSTPANIKPAKLTLTPHHLFYLLSKFEVLGVDIGPMNVRLENLQHDAGFSNYVSFMGKAPKSKGKQADTESLRSVSSIRSVMSGMSSLWSNLTSSRTTSKAEKQEAQFREDIRYLYSCFTKIPALRLAPDHRARLISGYEEFPFDTAVPLFAFKNVSALEICDIDFRQFHGWDRLAEQVRSLTVKRANVDDPIDLLQYIILDDMEKRRRRSFKTPVPTTPSTPGAPWGSSSPKGRQIDLSRTMSAPSPASQEQRRPSAYGSPHGVTLLRNDTSDGKAAAITQSRQRSNSPSRPIGARQNSLSKPGRAEVNRRSSGSSGASSVRATPRNSSTDLSTMNLLPSSKWCFLRHLSLAENGLTYISTASLAPVAGTLQSLDLSGNLFSEVPDALASLTHLRALNLSNCMIDGLTSLARSPLPAITVLNLRSNRLLSLAGIERLYSLERLDLRDNKLHDPTELSRLTSMPDVVDVFVMKNAFTRTHPNYRVTIFNVFRSTPGRVEDVTIDGQAPSSGEKKSLVDWVPERANVPVIKPPHDDDDDAHRVAHADQHSETISQGGATEAELLDLSVRQSQSQGPTRGHRRATSDGISSQVSRKKKRKPPRRRIVELSQAEATTDSSTPSSPPPEPAALQIIEPRPQSPSDTDRTTTPVDTPAQEEAPNSALDDRDDLVSDVSNVAVNASSRPTFGPMLSSVSAVSQGRIDSSFHQIHSHLISEHQREDESALPQDASASTHLTLTTTNEGTADTSADDGPEAYRRKITALKQDLGPNWLSGLSALPSGPPSGAEVASSGTAERTVASASTARVSGNDKENDPESPERSERDRSDKDVRRDRARGASPPVLKGEGRVRNERIVLSPAPPAPPGAPAAVAPPASAVGVGGRSLG